MTSVSMLVAAALSKKQVSKTSIPVQIENCFAIIILCNRAGVTAGLVHMNSENMDDGGDAEHQEERKM